MAFWGEIGSDNRILRVTVGNDVDPDRGYEWLVKNLGGRWVEVSYDGSIGDMAAGEGSLYCETHASFACEHGCDFGDFWREQKTIAAKDAAKRTWFMSRVFACDPNKYIPPLVFDEMCYAVNAVIADSPERVADIGSGIGTLGVTVGAETGAHVTFVEPDETLSALTQKNSDTHRVSSTVVTGVSSDLDGTYDAIISDVPCWPSNNCNSLMYGYALDGGDDGLNVLRQVVEIAEKCLRPDGLLALRSIAKPVLPPSFHVVDESNNIILARKSILS